MKQVLKVCVASSFFAASCFAGQQIAPSSGGKEAKDVKKTVEPELHTFFPETPRGTVTVGGLFSEHNSGGYVDSITGLWSPLSRDAFLFYNSRFHLEDNGQSINTSGLGFRKLFRDQQVIIGGNIYYDSIQSSQGNDFDQLGLGVEILTKWVDARFNYYLPENDIYEVDRITKREHDERVTPTGTFSSSGKRNYKTYEGALEGFNAEVGFLVPGLDRYLETRVYAGYYHYDNPFGGDFEGFKARVEARLLPGVIADVEYWEDEELNGGNWTAGISVSVPFSLFNLARGRSPFEGIEDAFKPGPREFEDRLGDQVDRSHRIQTITSAPKQTHRDAVQRFTPSSAPTSSGAVPFPIE